MQKDVIPKYEAQCTIGFGALQIRGFSLPEFSPKDPKKDIGFKPMDKLWASVRRYNRKQYGVNVTGLFISDLKDNVVSCSFCLDYGYAAMHDIDQKVYEQRFINTFDAQMSTLKETIKKFLLDDENGYVPYLEHLEKGDYSERDYNEMYNRFLKSIGLKKPEDEAKKKEFQKKFDEAYKNAKPPKILLEIFGANLFEI